MAFRRRRKGFTGGDLLLIRHGLPLIYLVFVSLTMIGVSIDGHFQAEGIYLFAP